MAAFVSNRHLFSSMDTLLSMSSSQSSFKSNLPGCDLIKYESKSMCKSHVWSLYLCLLAISSVINRKIFLHYPDFGPTKYHSLFNQLIIPRNFYVNKSFVLNTNIINVLSCCLSKVDLNQFKANNFVALIKHTKAKRPASNILDFPSTLTSKKV